MAPQIGLAQNVHQPVTNTVINNIAANNQIDSPKIMSSPPPEYHNYTSN